MDILIVGVGGQGTLLASRVLGKYALDKGFDVKLSEVHGMAQRGGSVMTYVRIGEKIASPIIDEGRQISSSPLKSWKPCAISITSKRGEKRSIPRRRSCPCPS